MEIKLTQKFSPPASIKKADHILTLLPETQKPVILYLFYLTAIRLYSDGGDYAKAIELVYILKSKFKNLDLSKVFIPVVESYIASSQPRNDEVFAEVMNQIQNEAKFQNLKYINRLVQCIQKNPKKFESHPDWNLFSEVAKSLGPRLTMLKN